MRVLAFTRGPEDWRALLADPVKHWRTGYSARTLAHSWEAADGFPPEVASAVSSSHDPLLAGLAPVLAIPEFRVPLPPTGGRPSQNDIFVLARSLAGPVAVMVEGKVDESFGPVLGDWLAEASPGKRERLDFLLRTLSLADSPPDALRYQLFHRAASAVVTGEQYRAAQPPSCLCTRSVRRIPAGRTTQHSSRCSASRPVRACHSALAPGRASLCSESGSRVIRHSCVADG